MLLRLLVGLCIASSAAAAARGGGQQGARSDTAIAVREILSTVGEGTDVAESAARIAALGPEAAGGVFEVLCGEPRGARREVAHAAAAKLGRVALLSVLAECRAEEATPERGLAALELLAALGQGRDLELVPALAGPAAAWTPELGEGFRAAFAAILARDEEALRALSAILTALPVATRDAAIRELGTRAEPSTLVWLGDHLEGDLSLPVLSVIERLPAPLLLGASESMRNKVRDLLSSGDGQCQRKAAIVAGAVGDFEAVDLLIELVEDEDRCAREGAHAALQRLFGLNLPAESARWEAWLGVERRWYEEDFVRHSRELDSCTVARVLAALTEIGGHRYERHRLAQSVLRTLERREPGVRDLAIRTLERIGSPAAIPDLVRLLEDPDEGVARLAWQALRGITGRDLPLEAEAWQAVL
jgi:HEAT repeat protein